MTQPYPQRIVFSYSVAFNLDLMSRLVNGLPARKICGGTNFSNAYDNQVDGRAAAELRRDLFRDMVNDSTSTRGRWVRENVHRLRGFNLACTCRKGAPCHGDVLIELANGPACVAIDPPPCPSPDTRASTPVFDGLWGEGTDAAEDAA